MESLAKKLEISYETILIGGMNDNINEKYENEPINKLITNYQEIENIVNAGKEKIYQFLYFNWKTINEILYDNEKLINLNDVKGSNNKLSELFYLDLILMYLKEILTTYITEIMKKSLLK